MKITPPTDMTPGPWTQRNHDSYIVQSPSLDDGWIYTIADCSAGTLDDHQNAVNAKAIAATPQLLAALEFYANPENWKEQETGIGMAPSECEDDYGSSAREALTLAGYTITP